MTGAFSESKGECADLKAERQAEPSLPGRSFGGHTRSLMGFFFMKNHLYSIEPERICSD